MKESGVWATVRVLLKGFDPIRVENGVLPGTPDVNCTLGWIELKYLSCIPVDRNRFFNVAHFRPVQRAWLYRRWMADHRAWLLLRAADDWIILTGRDAALFLGREPFSYNDILKCALAYWPACKSPPVDEFVKALTDGGKHT